MVEEAVVDALVPALGTHRVAWVAGLQQVAPRQITVMPAVLITFSSELLSELDHVGHLGLVFGVEHQAAAEVRYQLLKVALVLLQMLLDLFEFLHSLLLLVSFNSLGWVRSAVDLREVGDSVHEVDKAALGR